MPPKLRLALCGVIIILSAAYALLVGIDVEVAKAVALGYIAVVITIFLLMNIWRRP